LYIQFWPLRWRPNLLKVQETYLSLAGVHFCNILGRYRIQQSCVHYQLEQKILHNTTDYPLAYVVFQNKNFVLVILDCLFKTRKSGTQSIWWFPVCFVFSVPTINFNQLKFDFLCNWGIYIDVGCNYKDYLFQ